MFSRKREEPRQAIYLIPCRVCGSNYINYSEVNRCAQDDMVRFIYERLGGTYQNPSSGGQE